MHLTRAFATLADFPAILFAAVLLLATSCAHVRAQPAPAQPAPLANTFGELKTAVILVNFTDNTTQPKSAAEANSLVFGQVSDFLWEASYQKTLLSGDTFGWFTIAASPTLCDTATIVSEGNRAADRRGRRSRRLQAVRLHVPVPQWLQLVRYRRGRVRRAKRSSTSMAPQASHSGRSPTKSAMASACCIRTDWTATSVRSATPALQQGYADPTDIMGSQSAHFNAFQKERLGWLNTAGVPSITTVTASGRHVIEPYGNHGLRREGAEDPRRAPIR